MYDVMNYPTRTANNATRKVAKIDFFSTAQKKTFNIDGVNIQDMAEFVAPRKQTEFVNQAIRASLDVMKRAAQQKQAAASLQALANMRDTADMADGQGAVALVRAVRHERADGMVQGTTAP